MTRSMNRRILGQVRGAGAALVLIFILAFDLAAAPAQGPAAPARRSALEGSPGYIPPADPESLAVARGRRSARLISMPLTKGRGSLEDLARTALSAIEGREESALRELCVSQEEFGTILWPEFPQSRAITGAKAADGWYFLFRRNEGGIHRAIEDRGGRAWALVRVEQAQPPLSFRNFRMLRGIVIVARDENGAEVRLDLVRSVVERRGVYKIYSLKD